MGGNGGWGRRRGGGGGGGGGGEKKETAILPLPLESAVSQTHSFIHPNPPPLISNPLLHTPHPFPSSPLPPPPISLPHPHLPSTAEVQNRQLNSHTPISKFPTATTATMTMTMTMMRPVNKKIVGIAIVYIYTQKYIRVPKERKATLPSPARSPARVVIKKVIYNHLCMYG